MSTYNTVLLTGSFCLLLSSISCVRRDTVFMATDVSVLIPLSVAVSFSTCSVMIASRHLEGESDVWGRSEWNVEEERSVQGQGGVRVGEWQAGNIVQWGSMEHTHIIFMHYKPTKQDFDYFHSLYSPISEQHPTN